VIPAFTEDGMLPAGIHPATGEEFLSRFCLSDKRADFHFAFTNVLDFATSTGAIGILVGGSFVTAKPEPNDLDCVITYQKEEQIPDRRESLEISGRRVDVFFCSIEQTDVVASFQKLFTEEKKGQPVGLIAIPLREAGRVLWAIRNYPDEGTFEIIKRAYIRRHYTERQPRDRTLVTIHGIRTHADWNAEVTLIASVNGWAVAPFQYGYVDIDVFVNGSKRNEILDQFRIFIYDLQQSFDLDNISVVAHSFGTYIILRYMLGFDDPPVRFDTVVLCGAIVDAKLDLERLRGRAAKIYNEVAPNDEWVAWAKRANFGQDEFFGNAGIVGFSCVTPRLVQRSAAIFTHNNVIRRDVISQRWMPVLEANVGAVRREWMKDLVSSAGKQP
jgi:pimeloyl-ACP methyl ester carboxylesterase